MVGIVKYNFENKVLEQVYDGLDYGEAIKKLSELRRERDGSWYWIGKKENHLGLVK